MENRTKTSALEQQYQRPQYNQRHEGQEQATARTSSYQQQQNHKSWQEDEEDHDNNALHKFPTHPDIPQGNPTDGRKPSHDFEKDEKDNQVEYHENITTHQHAKAQREMLPSKEISHNGKRADGNGADFDDVPQSTSSRIERSRQMMGLQPQAPIVEEHDLAEHVCHPPHPPSLPSSY